MAKQVTMPESDFLPDVDNLDVEWVRQPDLYYKFASKLADARLQQEQEKNAFDIIKAEIGKDIRANPEDYDLVKATEGSINETILLDPKYTKAQTRVNEARHTVAILEAAVNALDHKRKALENLVYLHGQNYFSSPRARGEDGKAMEDITKKATRSKVAKLTRKGIRDEDDDE